MWQHDYQPVGGNLGLSALVAAIPIVVLFYVLGVRRKPTWMAASAALASAWAVALTVYGMPFRHALMSTLNGAAFGIFPIAWVVFASIMLYRLAVETGGFEIIKDSVGGLSNDRRLQALFIAFSFGAFIEGAAGFGAPVAVAGAMLAGLGFPPFYAAGICLLANTAPVAFGSIGIPVVTLSGITGISALPLSAMVGRICAVVSLVIPAYLVVIMAGVGGALEVAPAIVACGLSFAAVQLYVSNVMGPELTDILSSLTCIAAMALMLKLWKPRRIFRLAGDKPAPTAIARHAPVEIVHAWLPYILLVILVLIWGYAPIKAQLDSVTLRLPVPVLHNEILRMPPVTAEPAPYAAVFTFNWLSASGTACLGAILGAALLLGVRPGRLVKLYWATFRQLALTLVTITCMLGLAYLMNYAGMTSTLGLALAATGRAFPFFSAVLGWLGVFLTGSDTSSNALFGNLQVITADKLGINPVLTASVNSAAGVMGKMISPQSIAVAVAATGMSLADEGKLFRFTLKHSMLLAAVIGLIAMGYAYLLPGLVPTPTPR
jgi:lactate permease